MQNLNKKEKLILTGILILSGILFRTFFHIGDNIEFVTSSTLLAGSFLGLSYSLLVPLTIMILSDLIIGNTNIFLFTWSGYFFIGCLSYLSRLSDLERGSKILHATGLGIIATLWFYLWTNFGVWFLDSWGMYPKTFAGLINAYLMGLPFLKYQLIGNLVLVPLSFIITEFSLSFKTSPVFKRFKKIRVNI